MTVTDRFSGSALRFLAVLGAMAMALALLPQTAGAQAPPSPDACDDAPAAGFTDRDDISTAHRANVDCAADLGIVQGFEDNTFRPSLQVRRDQMASFIALTLDAAGVDLPAGTPNTFTDVGPGNTHANNINRLAEAGIVEGGPLDLGSNEYGPALRTRRDQMASFIMRAAGYASSGDVDEFDSTSQQFTDVPSGNVHFAKVNAAALNGITQGVSANQYGPRQETRRDQMASFVIRLLGFIEAGPVDPPTRVTVTLDPATGPAGTEITATLGGDVADLTSLDMSGDCVDDVEDVTIGDDDTFTFTIAAGAEDGACTITFAATYDDGTTENINRTFTVATPAQEGPITLDALTAAAGGSIAGEIENPGDVQNVAVTGCGFLNQNVTIGGDGRFTLTLPGGQAAGTCDLVFNILYTDGTSETQTVAFSVTAAPSATTAAPDLVSASVGAAGVVTYVFDQNITGFTPALTDFRIYSPAGIPTEPTVVNIGADNMSIIAQYPTAVANAAVRATIRDGAVQDAAGRLSTAADAPLGAPVQPAGVTTAPDLQSMTNCRTEATLIVCDFRFDQVVEHAGGPGFVGIDPTLFYVIASDQSEFPGQAVTAVSVDNRTVSIQFDPAASSVPIGSLVRGAVDPGAVTSTAPALVANVLQTEGRTGTPAFTPGAVSDVTDGPDLTGATVVGTNTVAFQFNEGIAAGSPVAGNFFVYDAAAVETAGTTAIRSVSDTTIVNVTFPAGIVANAVGASITDNAVFSSTDGDFNNKHELGLQNVGFTAGRTALPDLVRVNVSIDLFSNNRVDFVYDSALPAGSNLNTYHALVDAEGTLFQNDGASCTLVASDTTVRCDNVFSNAQVAAAVKGSVQDNAAPAPPLPPLFTEGHVPVTR